MKKFNHNSPDKYKIFYIHDYHPYRHGGGKQDDFDKHIMNIKDTEDHSRECWKRCNRKRSMGVLLQELYREIKRLIEPPKKQPQDFVIVKIPNSKVNNQNQNMIKICRAVANKCEIPFADGVLKRVKDTAEAHLGAERNEERHIDTIEVQSVESVKNKYVLLIDDVITTGSTMIACLDLLMEKASPRAVIGIALGKTTHDDK